MEKLLELISGFFESFNGDEAIDLDIKKGEIFSAIGDIEENIDELEKTNLDYGAAKNENLQLRKSIAEDCLSRMVLINRNESKLSLDSLCTLPLEDLLSERKRIFILFDERYVLSERDNQNGQAENSNTLLNSSLNLSDFVMERN